MTDSAKAPMEDQPMHTYDSPGQEIDGYHRWYYDTSVWRRVTFLGVPCLKSVSDMWNYQEILYELKPSLVVEFGTAYGGSALFFANVLRAVSSSAKVLTVDVDPHRVDARVRAHSQIEVLSMQTTHPDVVRRIAELRAGNPGPTFAILDSDHAKDHVLAEMITLRPLLVSGDYLVVEDGNINGHPVCPAWGEGPFEAISEYERRFPSDYRHDEERARKFGFTFAPRGFLIRN